MFDKIKEYFSKPRIVFIDKDGVEVIYKEHLIEEGMLVIETDTGLSKIPVSGLRIK